MFDSIPLQYQVHRRCCYRYLRHHGRRPEPRNFSKCFGGGSDYCSLSLVLKIENRARLLQYAHTKSSQSSHLYNTLHQVVYAICITIENRYCEQLPCAGEARCEPQGPCHSLPESQILVGLCPTGRLLPPSILRTS
jgi:hypothetical protein